MQTFNLDLSVKRVIPLLYAKQRNVGSKICIKLTDNEVDYVVPDDVTWSVWYSGAGVEGNYDKIDDRDAVVVNGSTATVELIYQMLDYPGPGEMCLVMNSADGTQLGLWNIPYWVEALPGADSKAATAYYQAFLQAQAKAEAAAERSEKAAARAEAAAGGTIIVSIDEGEYATHTAAEIYDAMQNRKTVVYRWDARAEPSELIPIRLSTPSKAVFSKPGYPTEFDIFNIEINAQGYVSYETSFSSELVTQAVEKVETDKAPVSYLPQEMNPEQQAQARENIGIVAKNYELIETITIDQDVEGIVRTQEPNGTPYKFERVFIQFVSTPTTTMSGDVYAFYGSERISGGYVYFASGKTTYLSVEMWQDCGYWRSQNTSGAQNTTSYGYAQPTGSYYTLTKPVSRYGYISELRFDKMAIGSTIKIWGVRA